MTPAQFARAVEVAGVSEDSASTWASHLVLVHSMSQSDAARAYQIDRAAVHRAVKRIQAASERCPCCGRAF